MIAGICCTHGRYRCLQRALRCFLDQDYPGEALMFICNSGKPLKLPENLQLPENRKVYIDNAGAMDFTSVGQKYNHAFKLMMSLYPKVDIVFSEDDDDIFLPAHLSEGVQNMDIALRNYQQAYKPQRSYYRYKDDQGQIQVSLMENTLEPSIFVHRSWIEKYGYADVSVKYHQQWLDPLIEQRAIAVVPHGISTLIYNWGDSWDTYKMSGLGQDNQRNFNMHQKSSVDMGNGILYPNEDNSQYYNVDANTTTDSTLL